MKIFKERLERCGKVLVSDGKGWHISGDE